MRSKLFFLSVNIFLLVAGFVVAQEIIEPKSGEFLLTKPGEGECVGKILEENCPLGCSACISMNCTPGDKGVVCITEEEAKECNFSATDNCITWSCGKRYEEACFAEKVEPKIASKSCQAMVSFLFKVYDFVPEKEIELQEDEIEKVQINDIEYTFQILSYVGSEDKCPVKISINSEIVDVPGVATIVKIPSLGIEVMPTFVMYDYQKDSTSVKLLIRSIQENKDEPVTFTEPSLTLWGKFLSWLNIAKIR